MKGKVYLVGAGPGDPDLLTLKALRMLRSADVVLHDALVSWEILALVPQTTELVSVGKRCGMHAITQEEINSLMVGLALTGRRVVRLKSGDPLIFGRAGEEMECLRRAEIEFEVVPGITAALGAAAAARISLTHRGMARNVVFVTAHNAREAGETADDWSRLNSPGTTFVVYMPGKDYSQLAWRLMEAGFAADTPCAAISNAAKPDQQMYRSTVFELLEAPQFAAPMVLIVGEVARMATGVEVATEFLSTALEASGSYSSESLLGH